MARAIILVALRQRQRNVALPYVVVEVEAESPAIYEKGRSILGCSDQGAN